MAIFEALIGGATTLLGGFFGSKKQKTETTIDYVKMARKAQEAGFNPLTALRNGGSAGFTTTVSHPGLSGVAEAVGQIGGSLGAALDRRTDPIVQKRDKVESALLDYQLAALQAGPKPVQMFGDVPARQGHANAMQTVPPMASARRVANGTAIPAEAAARLLNGSATPNMRLEPGKAPTVSSVGLEDQLGIHSDPKTADASAWEQRYAEPGEWVGGIYVLGADAIHNAKRALKAASGIDVDKWPTPFQLGQRARKWINRHSSKGAADPARSWAERGEGAGVAPYSWR